MTVDQIQLKKPEVIRSIVDTAGSFQDLLGDIRRGVGPVPLEEKEERSVRRYDTAEKFVSRFAYLMPANVKL